MGIFGDILGPVLAYKGTQDTNKSNETIADRNNAWNAEQYATRYQTQVKDLQAAGLNPMMAYSQSPGTAPSAQAVQFQNPMASAMDAFQKSSERESMAKTREVQDAQITNIEADTYLKQAQADAAEAQARVNTGAAAESALRQVVGNDLTRAQTASTFSQIAINKATLPKIAQEIATGGANAAFYRAAAGKAIAEGAITRADLDRALNEQAMQRSSYGAVRPYVKDAIGAIGGIKGAYRPAPTINKSYTINKR